MALAWRRNNSGTWFRAAGDSYLSDDGGRDGYAQSVFFTGKLPVCVCFPDGIHMDASVLCREAHDWQGKETDVMTGKKFLVILLVWMLMTAGCGTTETENQMMTAADGRTEITAVRLIYDQYSGEQFYLNVYVDEIGETGSRAAIEKRVGPMNYTGHRKEGVLSLSREETRALLEILGRYDLEAWSHLPVKGASSSPSRSLMVFSGDACLYDVPWNAKFPETLPPQEDIMYMELYNLFNERIRNEPGWEETISEDLEDPRKNPAYGERRVLWFGHEVRLVPGSGTWYEDGRYAEIDYEGKDWWTEEGFTGEWTLNREDPTAGLNEVNSALLTVREDGSLTFEVDGERMTGRVDSVRCYGDDTGFTAEGTDGEKHFTVASMIAESYEEIRVSCYPGPVPERQFEPIDVNLRKK